MLDGHGSCQGFDINDAGVIIGRGLPDDSNNWTGFTWSDRVMKAIDDLLPWDSGYAVSLGAAVNEAGQIAGSASDTLLLTPVAQPVGDIDGDCRVNEVDLLILLFEWGQSGSPGDLDGDGTVGITDFLLLLDGWTR